MLAGAVIGRMREQGIEHRRRLQPLVAIIIDINFSVLARSLQLQAPARRARQLLQPTLKICPSHHPDCRNLVAIGQRPNPLLISLFVAGDCPLQSRKLFWQIERQRCRQLARLANQPIRPPITRAFRSGNCRRDTAFLIEAKSLLQLAADRPRPRSQIFITLPVGRPSVTFQHQPLHLRLEQLHPQLKIRF